LYIVDRPNGAPDAMLAALREFGVEVVVCGDVYRGLARLGSGRGEPPDAVVLSLDWLVAEGYGFIPEADDEGRGVPVYVYSRVPRRERIDRALSLGARGVIEADVDSVERALGDDRVRVPWVVDQERPSRTPPVGESKGGEGEVRNDVVMDGPLLSAEEIVRYLMNGAAERDRESGK